MLHLYRDWVPKVSDYSICDGNFVILLLQSWPSMFWRPIKPNNHIYTKYPKSFFNEIKIWIHCKKKKITKIWYPQFPMSKQYIPKQGKRICFIVKSIHSLFPLSFGKWQHSVIPKSSQSEWKIFEGKQDILWCLPSSHRISSHLHRHSSGNDQRHSTSWSYTSNTNEKNSCKVRPSHYP